MNPKKQEQIVESAGGAVNNPDLATLPRAATATATVATPNNNSDSLTAAATK